MRCHQLWLGNPWIHLPHGNWEHLRLRYEDLNMVKRLYQATWYDVDHLWYWSFWRLESNGYINHCWLRVSTSDIHTHLQSSSFWQFIVLAVTTCFAQLDSPHIYIHMYIYIYTYMIKYMYTYIYMIIYIW